MFIDFEQKFQISSKLGRVDLLVGGGRRTKGNKRKYIEVICERVILQILLQSCARCAKIRFATVRFSHGLAELENVDKK